MSVRSPLSVHQALAAGAAAVWLLAAPAWAGKPEWVEQGKHARAEPEERHGKRDHGGRDDDRRARDDRDHRRDDDRRSGPASYPVQVGAVGVGVHIGGYFGDSQRRAVHDFYAPQLRAGQCPPGLAKKNNGCLPPGQAKKWAVGQRLPQGVATYPLPPDLRRRLGTPPAGHEFVRVAGDILLIAVGTRMVIDAIEDLTR